MKNLLRSCFVADPTTDKSELLAQNYHAMVDSGLGFDTPEDNILWTFIQDFFKSHGHVPELQTMRSHFTTVQDTDAVDRIERLSMLKSRMRGDFLTYLEEKATDRRNRIVMDLAKEMAQIVTTGIEVKDTKGNSTKLLGAIDAMRHVLDRSHDIVAPTLGSKLSGNLMQDEDDFVDRYDRIKADPLYGVGQQCGISQIDAMLNGAKRYELWIHTAFTGGLKCVTGGTEIWDVSTRRMRTVKEIYESGDLPQVHGLDESTWRVQPASVSHVVQQGVRLIWKVLSEYGKEIRVSGNHPFLTSKGWINAEDLPQDAWVAVPINLQEIWGDPPPILKESPAPRGDIRWERVRVERDGEEMTYDLSVPGIHNFVANGFITHNSTFALHWAYIQAIYYRASSVYFSIEMPYVQVRNLIYTMHSAHEKFREVREQLGITYIGLDYDKIKMAILPPKEEKFLKEYVIPDFNKHSTVRATGPSPVQAEDYGDIHIRNRDPEKRTFTIDDLRSQSELVFAKTPFSLIFVDHIGLMDARERHGSTTERLNEVIKDLKQLAMGFNRGMGIALVGLFQISREGYRSAEKNGGRYNLTHLSYANECVARGTLIPTDRGILPIESVKVGDQVWSRSGWKPVLDCFDQGVRPVWRVTNDRGELLEATATHRLRVLQEERIKWLRIDELQEGDWLLGMEGDYPGNLKPFVFSKQIFTETFSEDLAYLLGAWDGDGHYRPNKIAVTGNRLESQVRARIRTAFSSVFGEDLLSYDFPSRPGSFDEESKANVARTLWFEDLAGLRGIHVPDALFSVSQELVCAYMRGLWDTDGWVNNQGVVGLKMKNESFLREVQVLMTALGIDTRLEPSKTTLAKTGKTYLGWTLRIRNTDSKRQFQRNIGFTESHKAKMLDSTFVETPKDKRIYPVGHVFAAIASDYTPYAMIAAGRLKKGYFNAVCTARRDGIVSHGALVSLLRVMGEDGVEDPRTDILREMLLRRVTQVRRIDPDVRKEQVYDLEVDGDHEFQTGPFLSHNCERSADIVTATWLDDELRKLSRAIFMCLKSRDQKPFDRVPVRVEFPCRRMLTDNTSIEELDQKVKDAQGGDDEDKQAWKKRAKQPTPDLDFD